MLTGKSPWDLKPGYNPNNLPDVLMFDHLRTCKILTGISDVARDFLKSCLSMKSRGRLTAGKSLVSSICSAATTIKRGSYQDYQANSAIVQ
ncbi:hypothetical protein L3X38_017469 [Prunus dulcis]|uniref:Uncharacterized protein n=1 Tax=Prunus dulcis TaxID=3755 RepID=A0AAD4ZAR4_PRUDU|nr:hypothetical protein L3X38_017469 [Prunus dulcis]